METNPSSGHLFRFGPFEVDLSTGELRKHGVRLSLQEQPLRILSALLQQPGAVVSREDLCRCLWPQGTSVDFEHSLNAAVRRLRVTLGDEAETPRFIETVHRRGYRFLTWGDSAVPASARLSMVARTHSEHGRAAQDVSPINPLRRARLAVLPFISFDGDHRAGRFTEALTEETITQMARLCPAHVGVIARTSVMRVAGQGQNSAGAAETGRALCADYLVEGSIRREGDRVRIIAQLIESHDETHVWAATYDRIVTDALSVQMEVAEEIARAVASALNALQPALSREAAS